MAQIWQVKWLRSERATCSVCYFVLYKYTELNWVEFTFWSELGHLLFPFALWLELFLLALPVWFTFTDVCRSVSINNNNRLYCVRSPSSRLWLSKVCDGAVYGAMYSSLHSSWAVWHRHHRSVSWCFVLGADRFLSFGGFELHWDAVFRRFSLTFLRPDMG